MNRALGLSGLALGLCLAGTMGLAADSGQFRATPLEGGAAVSLPKSAKGEVSVIVKWASPSLAAYKGGIAGLSATSAQGGKRLDPSSPGARAYSKFLADKEKNFEGAMKARIPGARLVHRFRNIIGGVSVVLPKDRVKELSRLPGVEAVYPDTILALDTNRSPVNIDVPALWNKLGGQNRSGRGIIVGIVDTGIWPEHPSVAPAGMPAPPAKWHGTHCEFGSAVPGDAAFACNNKLIGAQRFMATFDAFGGGAGTPLPGEFLSVRDNNGHGSHTATTAAGNANVVTPGGQVVSGMAPKAHLAAYKVCFTIPDSRGSCYSSDSAAAIEQAIADGVDVINFSIGGGNSPYSEVVSLAFLDAYDAGVFVAASAGNDGPGANTVGHREPWVTTVAATTTDKGFNGSADLAATGASLTVTGKSSTGNVNSAAPIVLSATATGYNDDLCLNAAPAGSLTGKIVACKRGTNARVSKGVNVLAGGAVGMILYNPAPNTLNADSHALPALHIDNVQGAALVAFLTANPAATSNIIGGADDLTGIRDQVAGFSSRGGSAQQLGISKPDVGAPGVDILAAQTPLLAAVTTAGLVNGQLFQIISGTSMASPHVAGTAALLKQSHPDWTPGQIKSALMMTANVDNLINDTGTATNNFDAGTGRITAFYADRPGVTIADSGDNYVLLQDNLSVANYPSLYVPTLAGKVTVQRTLKSVETASRKWSIWVESSDGLFVSVPSSVTIAGGASKTISIGIDASDVPLGETRFATVRMESVKGVSKIGLRFPVTVVRKQAGINLTQSCAPTTVLAAGAAGGPTNTVCTVTAVNNLATAQAVQIVDKVPGQLKVKSVSGGTRTGNTVRGAATLSASLPPGVNVVSGTSPAGYLPLALFGVPVTGGIGDETIVNFNVPAFVYAGTTYTRIGIVSNGYVVVGGGTGADVNFNNQSLPNGAVPNNVLAPFWSDLDPSQAAAGDGVRVGTLTDGVNNWIVVDFQNVPNFSSAAQKNSFQIWIGFDGTQDVSFVYDAITNGEGGALTVGAENAGGTSGANWYYNGTGSLPTAATELNVTSTPAQAGGSLTFSYTAAGAYFGPWKTCAEMTAAGIFGTSTACVNGTTADSIP